MKIKLLVGRAGADFAQSPGEVVEVSDAEGKRMIEAGQALPDAAMKKETATKKAVPEMAAKE
jgi:hypothetical protein